MTRRRARQCSISATEFKRLVSTMNEVDALRRARPDLSPIEVAAIVRDRRAATREKDTP